MIEALGTGVDMSFDQASRAQSWQEAAMRSGGYDYFDMKDNTFRQVRNLNETLGVEKGFENMVEGKVQYNESMEIESMTAYHYGTVVDEEGNKAVYGQSVTYDKDGNVLSKSGWKEQIPSKKDPEETRENEENK